MGIGELGTVCVSELHRIDLLLEWLSQSVEGLKEEHICIRSKISSHLQHKYLVTSWKHIWYRVLLSIVISFYIIFEKWDIILPVSFFIHFFIFSEKTKIARPKINNQNAHHVAGHLTIEKSWVLFLFFGATCWKVDSKKTKHGQMLDSEASFKNVSSGKTWKNENKNPWEQGAPWCPGHSRKPTLIKILISVSCVGTNRKWETIQRKFVTTIRIWYSNQTRQIAEIVSTSYCNTKICETPTFENRRGDDEHDVTLCAVDREWLNLRVVHMRM